MKGFDVGRYLIRVIKFAIYYAAIIVAVLAVVYYTSAHDETTRFIDLIRPDSQMSFLILIGVFALVYPFVGFSKKEVYLNRAFQDTGASQDKDVMKDIFSKCGYDFIEDNDSVMVFRPKSIAKRISRIFEDKIFVNYAENPLVVTGLRKDVARLSNHMEYRFTQSQQE